MANLQKCALYYTDAPDFLVEYRGNFKEQIDKVSYACGDTITKTIGVVTVYYKDLDKLLKDVPSIIFIEFRVMYVLQEISPSAVDNITAIKNNPYLGLTGRGVLIGMVDTGIDYLNQEFIREDGTSRIVSIWDQTIRNNTNTSLYIGETYSNEQINNAINAQKNKGDPYQIVPSKDEVGHGTEVAGIIGARGYNQEFQGVSPDSDFVIVKLLESTNFGNILKGNGVKYTPVYNAAEILAGVEYLKNFSLKVKKPMVICLNIGSTDGNHDGNNLISKYLTTVGSIRGIALVAGVGNEGAAEGHASGYIKNVHDIDKVELKIPREMKYFSLDIWVQKPNKMSLNVISPTGEESRFIQSKINKIENLKFVFSDTNMSVRYYLPEQFTGQEVINVVFTDMKPGIWEFQLIGDYITDGRYNIWLSPQSTLPEDTKFLKPDPFITLTIPSTARKTVTVAYYGSYNESLVSSSGRGFNTNNLINPDVATIGINVLTTTVSGKITTVSGSSAATAIVAGACALLLQWGIVDGNDTTMYSTKIRSYLLYGAYRNPIYKFPSREIGYGNFDLLGTFNIISRKYRGYKEDSFIEYNVNNLFIRLPKVNGGEVKQ